MLARFGLCLIWAGCVLAVTAQGSSKEWNESETDLGSEMPEADDDSSNESEENRFERSPYHAEEKSFENASKCLLPMDSGPCRMGIPRYYFEPKMSLCKEFLYGGCRGNDNNFDNEEECIKVCRLHMKPQKRSETPVEEEEWNQSKTDLGSEEPEAADDGSEDSRFERSPYHTGHNGQQQQQQQRVQIPHIDANPCAQTRPHLGYVLPDVIFAHPSRCDKYINCVHGQPVIRECGPGTYFDPSAKNCGHWQTSYCLQTMKMPLPQASCTCNDYIIPPTHTVYIPPPNKHAPHHQPPVTRYIPPVTQPPTTRYVPPVTQPPTTRYVPPVTQPPTTRYVPPVTQPPTTRYVPPVTQPPTTRYVPPVTQPPTTRYVPPVTQPPTTRYVPPVTQPPKMCQCPCPVEQKNNGYNW